eukprot:242470_1
MAQQNASKSVAMVTWDRIATNVQEELLALAQFQDKETFLEYLSEYHPDWEQKDKTNAWVYAVTLCVRRSQEKEEAIDHRSLLSALKDVAEEYSGAKDEEKAKILSKSESPLFHEHPYDIQKCILYEFPSNCFRHVLEFVYGVKCEAIQERFNSPTSIPFKAVCGTVQDYICWAMTVKHLKHFALSDLLLRRLTPLLKDELITAQITENFSSAADINNELIECVYGAFSVKYIVGFQSAFQNTMLSKNTNGYLEAFSYDHNKAEIQFRFAAQNKAEILSNLRSDIEGILTGLAPSEPQEMDITMHFIEYAPKYDQFWIFEPKIFLSQHQTLAEKLDTDTWYDEYGPSSIIDEQLFDPKTVHHFSKWIKFPNLAPTVTVDMLSSASTAHTNELLNKIIARLEQ